MFPNSHTNHYFAGKRYAFHLHRFGTLFAVLFSTDSRLVVQRERRFVEADELIGVPALREMTQLLPAVRDALPQPRRALQRTGDR
jgi:hypothetical protein